MPAGEEMHFLFMLFWGMSSSTANGRIHPLRGYLECVDSSNASIPSMIIPKMDIQGHREKSKKSVARTTPPQNAALRINRYTRSFSSGIFFLGGVIRKDPVYSYIRKYIRICIFVRTNMYIRMHHISKLVKLFLAKLFYFLLSPNTGWLSINDPKKGWLSINDPEICFSINDPEISTIRS